MIKLFRGGGQINLNTTSNGKHEGITENIRIEVVRLFY